MTILNQVYASGGDVIISTLELTCPAWDAPTPAALQEQQNVGSDKQPKWEAKYTLAQLLADEFRLPAPVVERPQGGLKGLMGMPGVKVFKAQAKG